MGIQVKPFTNSVAQLRARHESMSHHSEQKGSVHELSHRDSKIRASMSQHQMTHLSQSPTLDQLSATSQKRLKTIVEILNDRISSFIARGDALSAELGQLRIDNDLVNTFFDEIHKLSD